MDDPFGPSLAILALFALAAAVHTAQAAVPYLDDAEINHDAQEGDAKARRALRLMKKAESVAFGDFQMSRIFLLLTALLIAWQWLGGKLTARFAERFAGRATLLSGVCVLIPFALLAFALTGVVPELVAAHGKRRPFDQVAPVAEWTLTLLSPITVPALWLGRALLRPFHIGPADLSERVTEEEIRMMVDIGEEKGAIETDEREMIENIFEFNNMTASDCMIHRKDITAVDVEFTDEEILETIRESGLSRFPVYEDSIDNVLGILTTRDYLMDQCEGRRTPLRSLIRPAHFVPESVRADVLFSEMQARKQHMAIVVDEYGGTSGLITLEDLLEEIVGNIYDEFDPKEEQDIQPLADGRWRVSGSAELENVAEALDVELPTDEEYDTLGGLIFSRLTEIPADGEHPVVECFGLRISVEEIADRRVEWAVVEKLAPEDEHEEANGED